jgi:hypothetical protein
MGGSSIAEAGKDDRQRRETRRLTLQIAATVLFSVGIVLYSWFNPDWKPWSAREPAEPAPSAAETAKIAPAPEATASAPESPAGMARERVHALLEDAQRQAGAGDLVTGALLALETLPHDADPEDRATAQRLLYEAHFNRAERLVLDDQIGIVHAASFSPDGTHMVTAASDRTVCLWRVGDGALIAKLRGHDDDVRSAVFSPDGRLVASASFDGTVRLWNVADAP